jgi:bifunctional non-homologous end joining protein LigD
VPDEVRVAEIEMGNGTRAARIIGGDLLTLLYTVQIGAIAVHAWLSRLRTIDYPDWSVIDLDPGDDVPFSRVVELAREICRVTSAAGLPSAVKTSGAHGIHVAVPLPTKTSYARSAALAETLAARIVEARPDLATVERTIKARPKGTIYVDAQQNAYGKSVVSAYSAREQSSASVSAPLRWTELKSGLRMNAFTIGSMTARVARVGDLWGSALRERAKARMIDEALGGDT